VQYNRDALSPVTHASIGVETRMTSPLVTVEFSDSSTLKMQAVRDGEVLSVPFRPQGIPAGRSIAAGAYSFTTGELSFDAANNHRLAPSLDYRFGEFYNGNRTGYTGGFRFRANKNFAATVSFSRDIVDLPGGVHFHTDLASLRLDQSFSTRMFLNAFIQYNNVTHQVTANIRYDFIHHPLSDVFLVYNDTRFQNVLQPVPVAQLPQRALILKVTHLLSF